MAKKLAPTDKDLAIDKAAGSPGRLRLRREIVARLRSQMEEFYRKGFLSELLLLQDALLIADSERSLTNTDDECPLGDAIAECFGVNALRPVGRESDELRKRRAA